MLLAAGDTFRAAAREQLQAWGERNNVTVISQTTGDSAAVCFDAVQAAKARGNKVWAVGTTSMRALESAARETGRLKAG